MLEIPLDEEQKEASDLIDLSEALASQAAAPVESNWVFPEENTITIPEGAEEESKAED